MASVSGTVCSGATVGLVGCGRLDAVELYGLTDPFGCRADGVYDAG